MKCQNFDEDIAFKTITFLFYRGIVSDFNKEFINNRARYHILTLVSDILNIATFQAGLFHPICRRYLLSNVLNHRWFCV